MRAAGSKGPADLAMLHPLHGLAWVQVGPATKALSPADRDHLRPGTVLVGLCDPLSSPDACREAADRGATLFALELVPRITRAQSMDVLSSQANIAGYRAVIAAAAALPRILPMMTTAAGTLTPAQVLVLGRPAHRPIGSKGGGIQIRDRLGIAFAKILRVFLNDPVAKGMKGKNGYPLGFRTDALEQPLPHGRSPGICEG
jgi:hypothetical protein